MLRRILVDVKIQAYIGQVNGGKTTRGVKHIQKSNRDGIDRVVLRSVKLGLEEKIFYAYCTIIGNIFLPVGRIGGVVDTVRILTPIPIEKVGRGIFMCENLTLQAKKLIRNEREVDGRDIHLY